MPHLDGEVVGVMEQRGQSEDRLLQHGETSSRLVTSVRHSIRIILPTRPLDNDIPVMISVGVETVDGLLLDGVGPVEDGEGLLVVDDEAAGLAGPVRGGIGGRGEEESPLTLSPGDPGDPSRTPERTQVRAQLRGVQAPDTRTVKMPFLSEKRPPVEARLVGLHVLVGDLIPGTQLHVGHDGHLKLLGGVYDGLSVTGAGVVHHAVHRVQAVPLHVVLAGKLERGGVGRQYPGRSSDLFLGEPQAEPILEVRDHELFLKAPDLRVLQPALLVVVHHGLQETLVPALHGQEEPEDGDGREGGCPLVPVSRLLEYLTLLLVEILPSTALITDRKSAGLALLLTAEPQTGDTVSLCISAGRHFITEELLLLHTSC